MESQPLSEIIGKDREKFSLSMEEFSRRIEAQLSEGKRKKILREGTFYCPVCKNRQEYFSKIQSNGVLGPGGWSSIREIICKNCFVKFSPEVLECGHKE